MNLTGLDRFFWVASFTGHVTLLFVLWIRKRAKLFPVFTLLITMNILRTVALYLIFLIGTKASYYYTYWSLAFLDVALQLAVSYEVASLVFRPRGEWARDVLPDLRWLAAMSVLIATCLTWLASPQSRLMVQSITIKGEFFSAALMGEWFVVVTALSAIAGLPFRTHVAKIAIGLGLYSILDVVVGAAHSYLGLRHETKLYRDLTQIRITGYLLCLIYWIIMLWRDAPVSRDLPDALRNELLRMRDTVEDYLRNIRGRRGH